MKFICFRAGKKDRPENTLLAIANCVALNKDWTVHVDIQMTADGGVILFKDDNTKRITNQDLSLSELSLKDLKKLDAAYNFQNKEEYSFRNQNVTIPTLKEVFEKFPTTKFLLDIQAKDLAIVDKIIHLIKAQKLSSNIILTSRENHIISALREKEAKWNYAATTVRARKIVYSNMFYLDNIIPVDAHLMIIPKCDKDSLFLRERIIAYCNHQDKQTWTWIFEGKNNDSNSILTQIANLEKQGLDGVFTSNPTKMKTALNSSNLSSKEKSNKIAS